MDLQTAIHNDVLCGNEGYLFLWQGRQYKFDYLLSKKIPSEESIHNFGTNITSRKGFCAQNKIEYRHIVFPSKPLVKKSYLPDGLAINSLYQTYYENNEVIYPLDELIDVDKDKSTFRKLDTHMTDYGSLTVIKSVFPVYLEDYIKNGGRYIEKSLDMQGDLAKMINPIEPDKAKEIKLTPVNFLGNEFSYREYNNYRDLKGNGGGISIHYCPNSVTNHRLLVFGDSFFIALVHLLRPFFREVFYIRSDLFKPELIALLKPNIVVTANAERYLSKVKSDNVSNFLFYEDIIKSYYKDGMLPNAAFLQAFSSLSAANYSYLVYKKFINNEKASLLYREFKLLDNKHCLINRKRVLAQILTLKPENKNFLFEMDTVSRQIEEKGWPKLNIPLKTIQRLATIVFSKNIHQNELWVSNFFNSNIKLFVDENEWMVCLVENLAIFDFDKIKEDEQFFGGYNLICALGYSIFNYENKFECIASRLDDKTLLTLYRLFLACYLFSYAYIVFSLYHSRILDSEAVNDVEMFNKNLIVYYFTGNAERIVAYDVQPNQVELTRSANYFRKILSSYETDKQQLVFDILDSKDLEFIDYIKSKSVAIVGPTEPMNDLGKEIDQFDIVIRLSYLGKEHSVLDSLKFGSKTSISYFSAHLRFFENEVKQLPNEINYVCVTLPKFAPTVLDYPNIRKTFKFETCFIGKPNLIQSVLFDILFCKPSKIKVFCSNLFLTKKTYSDSYPSTAMLNKLAGGGAHRGLNSLTFMNHDPINNFLIMKRFFESGLMEADEELTAVLNLSVDEYMLGLYRIYA
jgi:hypothetical protein